jgi:uncharacterized membrane protein SpoIIM required for sporulation
MPEINMTWTGVIIIAAATTLLAWEIIAFVQRKRRARISTWVQKFGFKSPIGVFVIGIYIGHFWTYYPPTIDDDAGVLIGEDSEETNEEKP